MRILYFAFLIIIFGVVGFQLWKLEQERSALATEVQALEVEAESLKIEQIELNEELDYFADTRNLLKELKSLFNYRKPEEKLIIIVPKD